MAISDDFIKSASPISRLMGHSLASAFGFCGLAIISLIPLGIIRVLIYLGLDILAEPLHTLENLLFVVDMGVFAIVFLTGVLVFTIEIIANTISSIRKILREFESENT